MTEHESASELTVDGVSKLFAIRNGQVVMALGYGFGAAVVLEA